MNSFRAARDFMLAAAVVAMCSAAAGAISDPVSMDAAKERAASGVIWTGGPPTMACISGSIGGSFFSVFFELYNSRRKRIQFKRNKKKYFEDDMFMAQQMALKFLLQPPLAIALTFPVIYYSHILFETEMIAFVAFVIGACGVPLIGLLAPVFENVFIPAVGHAGVAVINAFGRAFAWRVTAAVAPDMSNPGCDPKPKPKRKRRALKRTPP
jgi:hypothetical protein